MAREVNGVQTPYVDTAMDAPDASGSGANVRGGRTMPSGPSGEGLVNSPMVSNVPVPEGKETANSLSGLPTRIDGVSLGDGDPGPGGTVDIPSLDQNNKGRTFA
jgi:hypothetical protein